MTSKTFLSFVFAIRYETALVEKVFDVPVVRGYGH